MKRWNVVPMQEINGIKFGSSRESVRKELGNPVREFKKTKFSKNTTDEYEDFHVYFDVDNNFEAIEVFSGEVYIGEKKVMPGKLKTVLEMEETFLKDEDGCISQNLSIGVYAPNEEIESVLIGCKGYY